MKPSLVFSLASMTLLFGYAGPLQSQPAGPGTRINAPLTCTIQTSNGNYLTAVGGGGRITDVIHSDATHLLDWEKFTTVSVGLGIYGIQTINGHYLTAVGGGGRITDTIHSDATNIAGWERFRLNCTNP